MSSTNEPTRVIRIQGRNTHLHVLHHYYCRPRTASGNENDAIYIEEYIEVSVRASQPHEPTETRVMFVQKKKKAHGIYKCRAASERQFDLIFF
jgi:hypothetical protein